MIGDTMGINALLALDLVLNIFGCIAPREGGSGYEALDCLLVYRWD
jgi:hypothetical protein